MKKKPKMIVRDQTEDIGFIAKKDPWKILSDFYGMGFAEYRENWKLASDFKLETDYPLQLDFELNNSCNLKCPSCIWSRKKAGNLIEFPFEHFKRIITDGVKKGLRAIDFSYINEPLLRKDLCNFIRFAKDAGVLDIAFNTNAICLNSEIAEKLIDSGLTRIQFSLDASSEKVYNKVRPGANFKRILRNIEYFLRKKKEKNVMGLLCAVSFLRLSGNDFQLKKFIAYWRNKVDYLIIRELVLPFGRESEFFKEKKKMFSKKRHIAKDFRCNKPWQRLIVRADGTVLPCCVSFALRLPMGNAFKDSVVKIWNSAGMKRLREIHKKGSFCENSVCLECAKCSTG